MLLFLIVYLFLPELRDEKGYIQMAYVASQLMAFLLLSIVQLSELSAQECVGLSKHFFLLIQARSYLFIDILLPKFLVAIIDFY